MEVFRGEGWYKPKYPTSFNKVAKYEEILHISGGGEISKLQLQLKLQENIWSEQDFKKTLNAGRKKRSFNTNNNKSLNIGPQIGNSLYTGKTKDKNTI